MQRQAKKNSYSALRIALVGGGSGGPTAPLIAVAQAIKRTASDSKIFFLGSRSGADPGRILANRENLPYFGIFSGKLRRYLDLRNLVAPVLVVLGFLQSILLLLRLRPSAVLAAGSFVSVPVAYAAWLMKIPVIIHQQDIIPSLANRLISPIARCVTVSLEESLRHFSSGSGFFKITEKRQIVHTGNPVRAEIFSGNAEKAKELFGLEPNLPTVLIIGGGTGAAAINDVVSKAVPEMTNAFQIIHVTGKGKLPNIKAHNNRYHCYEFLSDELPHALAAADIVVSRAGFSFISELAALGKIAIIVPMPESHQLANAFFLMHKKAAIVVLQQQLHPEMLSKNLRQLLFNREALELLRRNIKRLFPINADERIAAIIIQTIKK